MKTYYSIWVGMNDEPILARDIHETKIGERNFLKMVLLHPEKEKGVGDVYEKRIPIEDIAEIQTVQVEEYPEQVTKDKGHYYEHKYYLEGEEREQEEEDEYVSYPPLPSIKERLTNGTS